MALERYKLTLAYDGAAFAGSQRQAATAKSRTGKRDTVQGELEKALRALGWRGRSVILAGRTDAGAHASGQVAACDLDWEHGADALRDALNARLPFEIVVKQAESVAANFHPRFDAVSRCYRYSLFCAPLRDPLLERLVWRVWPAFDPAVLSDIAGVFLGQHDFGAFGSATTRSGSTVRTVLSADWRAQDLAEAQLWQFHVRADAFLYRMVRRLVFVQVAVAQGRCAREAVARSLRPAEGPTTLPAGLAPAHGLELVEIDY